MKKGKEYYTTGVSLILLVLLFTQVELTTTKYVIGMLLLVLNIIPLTIKNQQYKKTARIVMLLITATLLVLSPLL